MKITIWKIFLPLICILSGLFVLNAQNISAAPFDNLPKNRDHIRIFRNMGTPDEIIRNKYDLSFFPVVKQADLKHTGLKYELNAYMMVPREKSARFKDWWCTEKLHKPLDQCIFPDTWLCDNPMTCDIPEEMFLHFKKDTVVTLYPGTFIGTFIHQGERTWTVKGWDPDNFLDSTGDGFMDIDMNKDGNISDTEWANRPKKNASARIKQDARIPAFYWGNYWEYLTGEPVNHHACYLMNVGNQEYVEFMSDIYIPGILNVYYLADGIYFDNSLGSTAKTWSESSEIVEYDNYESFYVDNFYLLQRIKENMLADKIIIGNQWDNAEPIDGLQKETWIDITYSYKSTVKSLKNALDLLKLRLSQGLIFLAQYSPVFHTEYAMTGPDVPVSRERDQLYALSSYYLVAGERSYFGYGNPSYRDDGNILFKAINVDVGSPIGNYFIFSATTSAQEKNILLNSSFEVQDNNNNPSEWTAAEPVEIDNTISQEGTRSVRIDSITNSNNNNSRQAVTLKPYTTYTLSGYIKTENIWGPKPHSGANFYPYDLDDSNPILTGCMSSLNGTNDWTFLYCTFTTGNDVDGNIYYRIQFGSGTAWFDNIVLREGKPRIALARKYSKALVIVRPRANEEAGYEDPATYKLHNIYRQVFADGSFGQPSDSITLNSGEAAILSCTNWDGNKYIAEADCLNSPPSVPVLLSPVNNQTGLDTTVTFRWNHSRYPDENTMTYSLSYCTNDEFIGCSPIVVSSRSDHNNYYAHRGNLSHLIILGMVFTGGIRNRKKFALFIVLILIAGGMILSCGGGSSGSSSGGATGTISKEIDLVPEEGSPIPQISYTVSELIYTVSGLNPGTTYYWKVTADDGIGGTTESETWSFTTK